MSFLLAGLLVAREEEDSWFESLVIDEIVAFTGEALRTSSVETNQEASQEGDGKIGVEGKVEKKVDIESDFEAEGDEQDGS